MKFFSVISCILYLSCSVLYSQSQVRISLASTYPIEKLKEIIIPLKEWRPYPKYSDPEGFENIPVSVRQAYIKAAERGISTKWPVLPATLFLEYIRNGNRTNYEKLSFDRRKRLSTLVLAEVFERQDRFMDQIINGIWAICEESFWGVPAHNKGRGLPDIESPIVDLFAAETASLIAWTHYLMSEELDQINPLITKRMVMETDRRIFTPYLLHNDWDWMGFTWRNRTGYMRPVNNWNPWINSNVIACALLMEKDPQRRLAILHKAMDSIDNFVMPYPKDGGCDEGPAYWGRAGASLFDCLELLYLASDGEINIFKQPLITNIGSYIYKVYISRPYFINFADAPAKMHVDAPIVYRYGKAIGDTTMMKFAAFAAQHQNLGKDILQGSFGVLNRILPALFTLTDLLSTEPVEPFIRDVWFPEIQVMAARSNSYNHKGFYVAAKGGHNNESHNHNDVGNFIVYADGQPVLIDAGSQTYTAKTFSRQRYELWNNQSAYHNLPKINGVMQKEGHQYKATDVHYDCSDKWAQLSLNIASAYPDEAFVTSWKRTIRLNRNESITIVDEYHLNKYLEPLELNFLTPLEVDTTQPGKIALSKTTSTDMKTCYLWYPKDKLEPYVETIVIEDDRLRDSWGSQLRHIVLKATDSMLMGHIQIIVDD